jgi:hypothetical protein
MQKIMRQHDNPATNLWVRTTGTIFNEVLRILQPVEKVVVGPVGSPREPENKSKTLRKRRIRPPNRRNKRARWSFSTRWSILRSPYPEPCIGPRFSDGFGRF